MTIPASYSAEEKFNFSADTLTLAINKALTELKWNYDQTISGLFKGHIRMSLWSFGEDFTISTKPEGIVRMKSICSFPLTVISWGKNKRNVHRFFTALNKVVNGGA